MAPSRQDNMGHLAPCVPSQDETLFFAGHGVPVLAEMGVSGVDDPHRPPAQAQAVRIERDVAVRTAYLRELIRAAEDRLKHVRQDIVRATRQADELTDQLEGHRHEIEQLERAELTTW